MRLEVVIGIKFKYKSCKREFADFMTKAFDAKLQYEAHCKQNNFEWDSEKEREAYWRLDFIKDKLGSSGIMEFIHKLSNKVYARFVIEEFYTGLFQNKRDSFLIGFTVGGREFEPGCFEEAELKRRTDKLMFELNNNDKIMINTIFEKLDLFRQEYNLPSRSVKTYYLYT